MKNIKNLLAILTLLVCVNSCSSTGKTKPDVFKQFADNGRTVDSLQKAFSCESITLDKWESSDVTDSTFSFCLINAKIVPTMDMTLKNGLLKEIAKSIKKTVKNPTKYNSYQIVFVKSDKFVGGSQVHQLGGTISSKDL